jgi:trans-2-enoyl-CoA reductase
LHDVECYPQLKEPEHEIITIGDRESDEEAGRKDKEIITKMSEGQYGKKVLLKMLSSVS